MKFRRVGRSGLEVSVLGVGSWPAAAERDDDAIDLLRRAYELGVRFFDTANFYQGGERERVVGRALAPFPRETYVLATKVSFAIGDPPNNQGLSRKHVVEQCHASLKRLGTTHLDLYQCHRFDPETPLEETCRTMDDLVRAGKILYWGVTSWPAAGIRAAVDLCAANGWVPPISDQEQYSALSRTPEATVFPVCRAAGLAGMAWSPLAMGMLGGRYRSLAELPAGSRARKEEGKWMAPFLNERVIAAVNEAREVAQQAGIALPQLALAWCLSRPGMAAAVIGASSVTQLEESVAAADLTVEPEVLAAFDVCTGAVAVREQL